MESQPAVPVSIRLALHVTGTVQGVGFRPFVFNLAGKLGLSGWVRNEPDGVFIEIEGQSDQIDSFVGILKAPPLAGAQVRAVHIERIEQKYEQVFSILPSAGSAPAQPSLPADSVPCAECLAELNTPGERRFHYPFTNCAQCGPRFTIALALPYDRIHTTMRAFSFCEACEREYKNPADRRFHAQPIACPACGPSLLALDARQNCLAKGNEALYLAVQAIREGKIAALKGVGGFQLLVNALHSDAVATLRRRKHRPHKALALMFSSLEMLNEHAVVSDEEAKWLDSREAPIVLVRRRSSLLCDEIAFQNPWIGAMLPSSPLHRILMDALGIPIVCTSGNRSGEPICVDDTDAFSRLDTIADLFISHNRPIARPVDDSVARVLPPPLGFQMLRRARGFCPLPIRRPDGHPIVLALGAHLKNTAALGAGNTIVMSQHIGDLDGELAAMLLERTADELIKLYDRIPEVIACDLHPDYFSSRIAERLCERFGANLARIQHHHAHIAAVVAEHSLSWPVLGLAWDGLGLGLDGGLWGGETLLCEGAQFKRLGTIRSFALPGAEKAVREGRRAAAGMLYEVFGSPFERYCEDLFDSDSLLILRRMLQNSIQSPQTTSIGRLFDAICALGGGLGTSSFEGQAAMHLEFAADAHEDDAPAYPFPLRPPPDLNQPWIADWEPMLSEVLFNRKAGKPLSWISARFHQSLAGLAIEMANRFGQGLPIVLSGGCFQNRRLVTKIDRMLRGQGFRVYTARLIPPNDGGISLGQARIAGELYLRRKESELCV